ncbi:class I adenylate-forming enzyme family protein [Tengunoibacter tsumagoiensis]|uniref:Long-chain-fatty-acid--CoA ligase n=1 Tax=Tengunoibacter tsumagoiensis TaxID=2014871 RepID=A0A402A280_9CHLR|nr:AMP-binding protein [Tengunoibacter tsumagoiensis]GCE13234.1 long-chain-fatty-acid--CoA ligase [Tengunoibacter tsumagoiensis]
MSEKMITPELFRPSLDFPAVSYDQLLRSAAERNPERHAIIYHNLRLTYREVVAMVNSIANGLHALGLQKGDRLCLLLTNRPEYIITFIAAASLGVVISPINPAYKEREITYQLENSEAQAILIQEELAPLFSRVLAQHTFPELKHILITGSSAPENLPGALPFATLLRQSSPRYQEHAVVGSEDLLALPYSSGTTGLPKGAMLTHGNLSINNLQFITVLGATANDKALLFLPFYHIYGVMLTGSFLACGGTQVMMERFDLQQSLELSEKHQITYYFAVPPIILALAHSSLNLEKLNSVKYIFSGAAPLPIEPARIVQSKIKGTVVQGYGMTETSPLTHSQPYDPELIRLGSVGFPIHNTLQKLVEIDDETREVAQGENGELLVKGPQVMTGYWRAPEETERVLKDGWFHTGDIGHLDEDGYLYIVDRKKEMIKYKGFGIAPAEIETTLLEHPAIVDAAVIGIPDPETGEQVKGFIVVRPGASVTREEIISFVNGRLAGYKHIHVLEIIDAIPKTTSGKILRRTLKEREQTS